MKLAVRGVTANGVPRLARSRLPLQALCGEHQVGKFAGRTRVTAKKKPLESAGCLGGRLYLHLDAEVPQALEEPLREPGFVAVHKVLVAKVMEFDAVAEQVVDIGEH